MKFTFIFFSFFLNKDKKLILLEYNNLLITDYYLFNLLLFYLPKGFDPETPLKYFESWRFHKINTVLVDFKYLGRNLLI